MPIHPATLESKPMVSVCCITYNHEKYIRDAIGGFLKQTTTFPFEIIIHDDASTDNTTQIIRSYQAKFPSLFKLIIQTENQFSKGVSKVLKKVYGAASGKYIALCEGDDYWTDPLKLQKQVDFLEAHPDCSMCCHKVLVKYENHEEKDHHFPDVEGNQVFTREDTYHKYISATCSVMFRNNHMKEFLSFIDGFQVGDMPLYSFFLQFGHMGYLDQVMATYRKNEESYWHPNYIVNRFPVLFDTFVKIKTRLKIQGSEGLDGQIVQYTIGCLQQYYAQEDYRKMREIVRQFVSSRTPVRKYRRKRLFKYSLIAYLPGVYKLYKSTIGAKDEPAETSS